MQLTDGRNTQAVTGGAEIFSRHNETDLTGVIGMTKPAPGHRYAGGAGDPAALISSSRNT